MTSTTLTTPAPAPPSPWPHASARIRARRRWLLAAVAVAFTTVASVCGFPTGRELLTGWLLLVLWAACGGDLQVWGRSVRRDWAPLLTVLFAYDLLRGLAQPVDRRLFSLPLYRSSAEDPALLSRAHLMAPLRLDKDLFDGYVPTVWLQDHLYRSNQVHWYDVLAVGVYFSHFVVSLSLAIVLWAVAYPVFRRYLATLVVLTGATLVTYVLYPAAPPWMASLNGFLPAGVARVAPATLLHLGGHTVDSALERGAAYANPVAAVPSLHAAIPMMLLLFAWPLVRPRVRLLLAGYTLAMGFTLVYSGEHYVVDVLLGWFYAAGTVAAVRLVERRRGRFDRISVPNPPQSAER